MLAEFKALKPDLQVMAFVTLFVPEEFLNAPTHGSIQYHPSPPPAYRGASAINWQIIKGEKEAGLSIFWRTARYRRHPDNAENADSRRPTRIGPSFDRLFPMVSQDVEGVGSGDKRRRASSRMRPRTTKAAERQRQD